MIFLQVTSIFNASKIELALMIEINVQGCWKILSGGAHHLTFPQNVVGHVPPGPTYADTLDVVFDVTHIDVRKGVLGGLTPPPET